MKYIEARRREIKFRRDLPLRSIMIPLSLAGGFAANWFGPVIVSLPLLFPNGREVEGIKFYEMMTYSRLKGSTLDDIDLQSIAEANYYTSLCYYKAEKYDEAVSYLLFIDHDIYIKHVGRGNYYYILGTSYYHANHFKQAHEDLKNFMIYSRTKDKRRKDVSQMIEKLEILKEAGFW